MYFRYGLKNIKIKKDKIFIHLSYTPAAKTLKQKFGTLPVRYMRVQIENEEEFKILENVVRRYKFNLVAEDAPLEAGPIKKVLPSPYYPAAITLDSESSSNEDDNEPPKKKKKRSNQEEQQQQQQLQQQQPSTSKGFNNNCWTPASSQQQQQQQQQHSHPECLIEEEEVEVGEGEEGQIW